MMSPKYGSRLLPMVLDKIAKQQPDLTYASIPRTGNISDGFKDVTFSDIATATNHLAAWIDHTLGRSSTFESIAYLGVADLRFVVVFLAAVKCGYKLVLPSPRNPAVMNASLLEQTECKYLLYAEEVKNLIEPLLDHTPRLQTHPIEQLDRMIKSNTPHYPFEKAYEEAKWDPVLVLYSSGSTGPPKPIQMNHATFAVNDGDRNLSAVPGRKNQNCSLWNFPHKSHFYTPFPPFHLAGFSSMVILPIYYPTATLVMGPPTQPPTGALASEIMHHITLKGMFCPPIIAEHLVLEPSGLEKCKSLDFLLYAGAPLSQSTGDALASVTNVCQFYGQTETGLIHALVPRKQDWSYLEFHPAPQANMEASPLAPNVYEMVLHRNPALESVCAVSCNFPDVEVWRTKDLFTPHPTKPGLWRFYGRTDDFIVLSNAGKLNPAPIEMAATEHPCVSGALVVGHGLPRPCLILEPKGYDGSDNNLINEVWSLVHKANSELPSHKRVPRGMVIVAAKGKKFERAAKGTVIRKATGDKFQREVDALFQRKEGNEISDIPVGSA